MSSPLIISREDPSPEFDAQLMSLSAQGDERRRLGSSFNTSRVNAEAESLATEARVLKKAKQHKRAHDMYTRAIELDRFNHTYFHHRAETALNWNQFEMGMWDAQFGLDLCNNLEEYKADECFGLMWCTLTRCCMELRQYQKAKQFCQMGLALIDGENRFALDVLKNYLPYITDALESPPINIAQMRMNRVANVGHELMFVYTTNDDAPLQPELLAVDLDKSQPVEQIFKYIRLAKVREWTQNPNALNKGGCVFQVPDTSYFVTAIPVLSEEDRRVLQSRLMCACLVNTKIVLLKLDKADEPPTVDTKAYVAAVVKNAPNCESMYGKGQKLADE